MTGKARRRGFGALALVVVVSGSLVLTALAQDATPTPDAPDPSLCTVDAPSFDHLNTVIFASPPAGTPVVAQPSEVVPAGTPATLDIVAGITKTVREQVACFNAGEPLRAYALYTDAYLSRLFEKQGGFTRAVYDSFATPQPTSDPSKHTKILRIEDVRTFADGTAGATVWMRYASIPVDKRFFFTFVQVDGRWLIANILGEISFSVG